MIYEYDTDLLQSDCDIIAHGCNCFHTMGAGMAKSISSKYPGVILADKSTPYGDPIKLGSFSKFVSDDGVIIYNLYTQFKYGRDRRYLDYDALASSLGQMRRDISASGVAEFKFGTYRIGCNLAGGDWEIVSQILSRQMDGIDVHVYDHGTKHDSRKKDILKYWNQLHKQDGN